ncbi:uncharacterized protein PFL1_04628 [Pseudozyma flocculosa PF-1]|nr:uncharacterized protein PFL1_04628 [Pseudozyma flocculosa PF-1]EPQ27884.1 hypothetical protein PFL1_04628 [Pseudozyma flocculosa PF-1]
MPKRKASDDQLSSKKPKKPHSPSASSPPSSKTLPLIQVARTSSDCPEWPAPPQRMADAVSFLRRCARSGERVLVVPDKDADGLCSGAIMHRTLTHALKIDPTLIDVHLMTKGSNPAASEQREAMEDVNAKWVIVLDQGSRNGPPLVNGGHHGWQSDHPEAVRTMVIDHHWLPVDDPGPRGSLMLNACHHKPVATASLLTWVLCRPLWEGTGADAEAQIDYLAVLGTMGDLSVNVDWDPPFPDLTPEIKKWTKKRLGSAIALINAPRRTPDFDVATAWNAVLSSRDPLGIIDPASNPHAKRLYEARDAVALETERCTHTPPKFSKDGRVALLRIRSGYQVHPSIATRWSGTLKSKRLQVIMCANDGYNEGLTNFSCRIAQIAKKRGEEVNIIEILNSYADRDPQFKAEVMEAVNGNAFNGHPQASGGIFPHAFFERFTELMEIGVKPDDAPATKKAKTTKGPTQKNTLLAMGFSSTSPKKAAS